MIRPGYVYSLATVALAAITAVVIRLTATEAKVVVAQLLGFALIILVAGLALGMSRIMTMATVPVLATILLQVELGDDPSWIRSLIAGCLWFVTIEMGWEALERRDGSQRSAAAVARRVQEVTTVVGLSLVIGVIAAVATSIAPSRTVLLQAVVLCLVLGAFVVLLRRVAVISADEVGQ